MNFNLVEMYNDLLRFNKHILNELAEGLKHLPNLDGASKAVRVLLLGGCGHYASSAGSGFFYSNWAQAGSLADVGFFTTVKLD